MLNFSLLLVLLTLTTFTYILRSNHHALPSSLFLRILQQGAVEITVPVNEPLCDGVTLEPVSEDQRETSQEIRSHISNLQDGNRLLEYIESDTPKDDLFGDYLGSLVGKSVQWIVFFGIGVVALVLCLIGFTWAWCSARSRLKHGKVIHVGRGTRFYLWMSILFLVPLLGADIASLVFTTTQVHSGVDQTVCAIAIFGDTIEYGDPDKNWIGLVPLRDNLVAAVEVFPATVQNLSYPTGITDRASVNRAFTTASQAVTLFYEDNEGQTIDRADPAVTTAYIPTFIANLGPPDNSSTESGQILAEMQDKRDTIVRASQNITAAVTALRLLGLVPSVIQPILDQLVSVANSAAESVANANSQLKEYASNLADIVDALVIAMIVVFAVDIGFVVIALLAIILLCFRVQWPRRFVHLSWCVLGVLMIFTWALATLMWMAAFAVNDICGVADALITDPSVYNQTVNKFFPEDQYTFAKNLVYTCFYGDGDILGTLGEVQQLAPFSAIFASLDNTANLTESIQPVPDSIVIPVQQFNVSQIQDGLAFDDPLTVLDLARLRNLTNRATNQCTQVQDTWIGNSTNCTASMGAVFNATSDPDFNVGNPTCIGFNNWGTKQIAERYNLETFPQPSCGQVDGDNADVGLGNFIESFLRHRVNVFLVFGNVQSGLTDVASANANYMDTITSAAANIALVREQTSQIYPFLGDPETGILPNAYCSFLRSTFELMEDQACVFLLPGIYRDMIALLVAAFMGLFAVPFLCLFSKRLLQYRKQDKAVELGRQGTGGDKI